MLGLDTGPLRFRCHASCGCAEKVRTLRPDTEAIPLLPNGVGLWEGWIVWLALGNVLIVGFIAMAQKDLKLQHWIQFGNAYGLCISGNRGNEC